MSDECRVSPGQTLRVSLFRAPLNYRPTTATGCASCGRPWTVQNPQKFQCERCSIELDPECYRKYTIAESEREWWNPTRLMMAPGP